MDDIKRELRKISNDRLEAAGLAGAQLNLKLDGFNASLSAFKLLGGVKRLKRVLEWINVILGSVAAVAGVAEALKEIKDAISKESKTPRGRISGDTVIAGASSKSLSRAIVRVVWPIKGPDSKTPDPPKRAGAKADRWLGGSGLLLFTSDELANGACDERGKGWPLLVERLCQWLTQVWCS